MARNLLPLHDLGMSTTPAQVQRQTPSVTAHCKKCHSAIVFPRQVLENNSHSTTNSHSTANLSNGTISAIVVCRLCESKSVYSVRETEPKPAKRTSEENPLDILWRVKLACGQKR